MQPEVETKVRDSAFDIARGIGILVVLGHHSFNNSSSLYAVKGGMDWWILTLANRVLSFSVPLFLLISVVLSARSLGKPNADVKIFYKRRIGGLLWPYLVWTFIYWILDATAAGHSTSIVGFFTDFHSRFRDLIWGKAFFHLYFLAVLLQVIIILPPLVAAMKKLNPSFGATLVATTTLQALIFIAQHHFLKLQYPASSVIWYVGSVLPGIWIGLNYDQFLNVWKRWWYLCFPIALISGGLFLQQEYNEISKLPVSNYLSNGSLTVYASLLSIAIFAGCHYFKDKSLSTSWLEVLGRRSLEIYLIHPALILLLQRQGLVNILQKTHIGPALSLLLLAVSTALAMEIIRRVHLQRKLFGRMS